MLSLIYLVLTVLFVEFLGHSEGATDRCHLEMEQGVSCFGTKLPDVKWYYDPSTDNCQPFIYTGCGGNNNRFPSKRRCLRLCSGSCYDEDGDRWYNNGEDKPSTCGSCRCNNGVWTCPANAECLNALRLSKCDAIFCPDAAACESGLFHKDENGCETCMCVTLTDV